jgi:hypothetical protein
MNTHRWLRVVVGMVVIAAVANAFAPVQMATAQPPRDSFSGTLEPLAGLVQYLPSGKDTWETLTKVTLLHKGDQVRTGDSGAARLSTVTGIKIEIYPTTLIELRELSLSEGSDGALRFRMSQVTGTTYIDIEQALKRGDSIQIVTPSAIATVHGTRFYAFVSRMGDSAFVGDDNKVLVQTPEGDSDTNEADNIAFFTLNLQEPPTACTIGFLTANSKLSMLKELQTKEGRQILKDVLTASLTSNVNSKITDFLYRFLDLSEDKSVRELLTLIDSFDKAMELKDFMGDFRSFLRAYFTFVSTGPLASETCGNGQADPGEDKKNCAVDTDNLAISQNNAMCETEKGESLINDPPDCLPFGDVLRDCENVIDKALGQANGGAPTITPPTPSGVGF